MGAADFAQYTVLIVGDPTCGALAPSVLSNRATWTSAVMATAGGNTVVGNRIVWGASPVLARSASPIAGNGINDGIAYAAALSPATGHATGVYLDASCDGPLGANPAPPAGTTVSWNVSQHGTTRGTGQFTTLGGGKRYHFLTLSLGATLKQSKHPKAGVRLSWVINGTTFNYSVAREPGC